MKDKFDTVLALAGLEVIGLVAGGLGAMVAIFLANRAEQDPAKRLTFMGKAATWLAGMVTAAYLGPLVIIGVGLPPRASAGVIFFIGLGGMSMVDALLKQMPDIIKALRVKWIGG